MFAIIKFVIITPRLPPPPSLALQPTLSRIWQAWPDYPREVLTLLPTNCQKAKIPTQKLIKSDTWSGGDRDRESAQWAGGGLLRKWKVTSSSCTIQLAKSKAIMANRPWEQAQKKPLPRESCALSCHKFIDKHPVFDWICSLTLAWYFINHIRKL